MRCFVTYVSAFVIFSAIAGCGGSKVPIKPLGEMEEQPSGLRSDVSSASGSKSSEGEATRDFYTYRDSSKHVQLSPPKRESILYAAYKVKEDKLKSLREASIQFAQDIDAAVSQNSKSTIATPPHSYADYNSDTSAYRVFMTDVMRTGFTGRDLAQDILLEAGLGSPNSEFSLYGGVGVETLYVVRNGGITDDEIMLLFSSDEVAEDIGLWFVRVPGDNVDLESLMGLYVPPVEPARGTSVDISAMNPQYIDIVSTLYETLSRPLNLNANLALQMLGRVDENGNAGHGVSAVRSASLSSGLYFKYIFGDSELRLHIDIFGMTPVAELVTSEGIRFYRLAFSPLVQKLITFTKQNIHLLTGTSTSSSILGASELSVRAKAILRIDSGVSSAVIFNTAFNLLSYFISPLVSDGTPSNLGVSYQIHPNYILGLRNAMSAVMPTSGLDVDSVNPALGPWLSMPIIFASDMRYGHLREVAIAKRVPFSSLVLEGIVRSLSLANPPSAGVGPGYAYSRSTIDGTPLADYVRQTLLWKASTSLFWMHPPGVDTYRGEDNYTSSTDLSGNQIIIRNDGSEARGGEEDIDSLCDIFGYIPLGGGGEDSSLCHTIYTTVIREISSLLGVLHSDDPQLTLDRNQLPFAQFSRLSSWIVPLLPMGNNPDHILFIFTAFASGQPFFSDTRTIFGTSVFEGCPNCRGYFDKSGVTQLDGASIRLDYYQLGQYWKTRDETDYHPVPNMLNPYVNYTDTKKTMLTFVVSCPLETQPDEDRVVENCLLKKPTPYNLKAGTY